MLHKNPAILVPFVSQENTPPYYLTKQQLGELRNLVQKSLRERAMIELLYTSGIRVSELAALHQADVFWEARTLLVKKGKGKKDRLALFTLDCKTRLQTYLNQRQDNVPFLFLNSKGTRLQNRALQLTFEGYANKLGFKVTPHTMRHTFAAHLAQKGMPLVYIQDLLGHDNIENTQKYARLYEAARHEQYDYYL